ncbi:T9SS type A sorting domain-containing protein [Rasiella sp. SM2506]|uniref:T9SS type A sorting domain-containing protein n=1 Tax=Rasiella sp. SM2506 TaxID=3423914 RepID=UPI003D7BFE96
MKKLLLLSILLLFFFICNAQQIPKLESIHNETPNNPFIKVDRASMEKSPSYNRTSSGLITRQVNVDVNGDNILGDAANEPSIAVDPTNPNRIVIGWRQFDTVRSDFRQAGYGYSLDGGETWTFPGVLDPGVFRSDPILDFDAQGNFYYNALTADPDLTMFSSDVFKIDDGGVVWSAGVSAHGGDKGWLEVDRSTSIGGGNIYSQWTFAFSECESLNFTRSTNGATSFEACSEIPNFPIYGTLAVNAQGDLYQTGFNSPGVFVQKSSTAKDPNEQVTWSAQTIVPLGGLPSAGGPNPGGLLGHIWIDTDNSNGPGAGNIYVLSTVDIDATSDPADVMFSKSTDGGDTYSKGFRINNDSTNTAYQWFGTLSVAPNGRIDIAWLDTRNASPNEFTSVLYYAFSEDQGESWSSNIPISEPFNPNIGYPQQEKLGDYFDMVSDNDYAHLAWANTFTGGQDVYYTRITPENVLGISEVATSNNQLQIVPNPVDNTTIVSFINKQADQVILEIIDIHGRSVKTLLEAEVSGAQSVPWNAQDYYGIPLRSGVYFVRLTSGTNVSVEKVIVR